MLRFWQPLVLEEDSSAYREQTKERGPQDRQESVFFTHLADGTALRTTHVAHTVLTTTTTTNRVERVQRVCGEGRTAAESTRAVEETQRRQGAKEEGGQGRARRGKESQQAQQRNDSHGGQRTRAHNWANSKEKWYQEEGKQVDEPTADTAGCQITMSTNNKAVIN
jgi:hypothetical protein